MDDTCVEVKSTEIIEQKLNENVTTTNNFEPKCPVFETIYIECEYFTDDCFNKQPDKREIFLKPVYPCKVCDSKCSSRYCLKLHMKSHKPKKQFNCNMCNYKSFSKSALTIHQRVHVFYCKLCSYRCSSDIDLEVHSRQFHTDKQFSCKQCSYKCALRTVLVEHVKTHSDKPYSCKSCNYKCCVKNNLKAHMLIHLNQNQFNCDACDVKCNSKSALAMHKRLHVLEKSFHCDKCELKFTNRSIFNEHLKIHSHIKPVNCAVQRSSQTYVIINPDSLSTTYGSFHNGDQSLSCNMCGCVFSDVNGLNDHRKMHTDEKPFKCKVCNFKCAEFEILRIHTNVHVPTRKHKETFNNDIDLCSKKKRLKKRVKNNCDKQFRCKVCNTNCYEKSALNEHMLTHRIQCEMCDYICFKEAGMKLHTLLFHGGGNDRVDEKTIDVKQKYPLK